MKSVFGGMQKLNTSNLQHYYVWKTTAVFWCFSTDQTTLKSINKLNKFKLGFAISILSTSLSRKQIKSVWGKTSSWSTNEVEVKISPSVFILSFGSQIQNKNEFYLSFPSSFNNVPFHWRSGETSLCFFIWVSQSCQSCNSDLQCRTGKCETRPGAGFMCGEKKYWLKILQALIIILLVQHWLELAAPGDSVLNVPMMIIVDPWKYGKVYN